MSWIRDIVNPSPRRWEMYRRRHQHDRVVRSTHGVNCTGGCSWNIHVKDGIVTWEMQALDYPAICERPAVRAARLPARHLVPLVPLQPAPREVPVHPRRAARPLAGRRAVHPRPGRRLGALVGDPEKRAGWQRARGKGGFRRTTWDEASWRSSPPSILHTVKTHGPDRVIGFSPIPAMSMLSATPRARASCSSSAA